MKKKLVKVIAFKDQYNGNYVTDNYETLESWQEKNPKAKIIDTKITQKVYTTYENILLVTYEIDNPRADEPDPKG